MAGSIEVRVKKSEIRDAYSFAIIEMPVKSFYGIPEMKGDSLELAYEKDICGQILQHWRNKFVHVYTRRGLVFAALSRWPTIMTEDRAGKLIDSLLAQKVFMEKDSLIIPLTSILKCASPEEKKESGMKDFITRKTYEGYQLSID